MTDGIVEEDIETITDITDMVEAGRGPGKSHFPEVITTIKIRVQAIVGPGQDQEQVPIETQYNIIHVGNMSHFQGRKGNRVAPLDAQFRT